MIILINVFSQIDSLSDVRVFALARSDEHLFHGLNQEHQVELRRFCWRVELALDLKVLLIFYECDYSKNSFEVIIGELYTKTNSHKYRSHFQVQNKRWNPPFIYIRVINVMCNINSKCIE